jgi:hypothetical protein
LLEVVEGDLILRGYPRQGFRRVVVFKPAIGIGNFGPMIIVHLVIFAGVRIVQVSSLQRKRNRRSGEICGFLVRPCSESKRQGFQKLAEGSPQLIVVQPKLHGCFQHAQFVAGVEAQAVEAIPVNLLVLQQTLDAVR